MRRAESVGNNDDRSPKDSTQIEEENKSKSAAMDEHLNALNNDDQQKANAVAMGMEPKLCKIDFKRMAKKWPHHASDLRSGKRDPEEFANTMSMKFLGIEAGLSPEDAFKKNNLDLATVHALSVWPAPFEHADFSNGRVDLFRRFRSNLAASLLKQTSQNDRHRNDATSLSKTAMEEAWKTFRVEIEKEFFPNTRLNSVHFSPVVDWTDHDWSCFLESTGDFLEKEREKEINRMRQEIHLAAEGVKAGLDETRKTCWECNFYCPQKQLKRCSNCCVARYCSKQCQKAAWNCGHKNKCTQLDRAYKSFQKSADYIEHIHATGSGKVYPEPYGAYMLANCIAVQQREEHASSMKEAGFEGPSMEIYCRNLATIHRKEWWLFPDCTREELSEVLEVFRKRMDECKGLLAAVLNVLCYDLEGLARKKASPARAKVDSAAIQAILSATRNHLSILKKAGQNGPLPVELFLNCYALHDPHPSVADEHCKSRFRTNAKWALFKDLRDGHK